MILTSLLTDVRACQICATHLPHGARPVLQAGQHARILIAGQAPGRRVHGSGVPFDDPSGDRLRAWMGIGKDEFYDSRKIAILPMGFCYPGAGRSGDLPPRAECAPQWRQRLLAQMPEIKLTLVIGQYAQAYHLPGNPHANLTATVRAWREFWPQALPLPHPSGRNNIGLRKNPWFEAEVLPQLQRSVADLLSADE
ncbi:MAG: uracil-DNA glycosylase family protein [Pseudomonadota bacterium]